jgi:hypothetical protein
VNEAELARWSRDLFSAALFAYIAAMVASFAYLAFRRRPLATASTILGILGLSANVVGVRLNRARTLLRELMRPEAK